MRVVRYRLRASPEVEAWLEAPHPDGRIAEGIQRRASHVFDRLETTGPLAGDAFFEKLADDLWEVKISSYRVFATLRGSEILMAQVVEKKKGRLRQALINRAQDAVTAYVAIVDRESRRRRGGP